jgi:hypothetical protein
VLRGSYRRRLLDDEVLVKCMHQHWRVVTIPLLYSVLFVAILLLILVTMLDSSVGLVLLGLAVLVGLAAWCSFAMPPLVRWYSASYAVTSRRVLSRVGVFSRRYEQLDLAVVANPVLRRQGLDLLFGTGTIDLGDGHLMQRIPRVVRMEQLVSQLAANQKKPVEELTHLLRTMGYTNLIRR